MGAQVAKPVAERAYSLCPGTGKLAGIYAEHLQGPKLLCSNVGASGPEPTRHLRLG